MLLLKTPSTSAAPPEGELTVKGGGAGAVAICRGQLLTVIDPEGGQAAALFAITTADPGEFLSPHHTRVFGNSFLLRLGMRLVTNRRRPIFVLSRDSVGRHDLLLPMPRPPVDAEQAPAPRIGLETAHVKEAFERAGQSVAKLPDPVNVFLNVEVDSEGRLTPRSLDHPAGSSVTFRVLIDAVAVIAARREIEPLWAARAPSALCLRVHNEP